VLVYHRTNDAAPILRDGFHEGHDGYYLNELSGGSRGVCVTAPCPDKDEEARGVLEIDLPEELFDKYELKPWEGPDRAVIPATELRSLPTRLLTEDAIDTIMWEHREWLIEE
jgi:hypothetical protein